MGSIVSATKNRYSNCGSSSTLSRMPGCHKLRRIHLALTLKSARQRFRVESPPSNRAARASFGMPRNRSLARDNSMDVGTGGRRSLLPVILLTLPHRSVLRSVRSLNFSCNSAHPHAQKIRECSLRPCSDCRIIELERAVLGSSACRNRSTAFSQVIFLTAAAAEPLSMARWAASHQSASGEVCIVIRIVG